MPIVQKSDTSVKELSLKEVIANIFQSHFYLQNSVNDIGSRLSRIEELTGFGTPPMKEASNNIELPQVLK